MRIHGSKLNAQFCAGIVAISAGAAWIAGTPGEDTPADTMVQGKEPLPAKESSCFRGHEDFVTSVAVSPDGKYALSGSFDQSMRLWNLETGEEIKRFLGHTDKLHRVRFSADGKLGLSCSRDGSLRVWDLASGKETRVIKAHVGGIPRSPSGVLDAAVAANGIVVTVGDHTTDGLRGSVRVWDLNTGEELRQFNEHLGPVNRVAISPDGKRVLSVNYLSIWTWDLASGKKLHQLRERNNIHCIAFSAKNTSWVAMGDRDGKLSLWNIETGRVLRSWRAHGFAVWSVACSSNRPWAVSTSGTMDSQKRLTDCTSRLWDLNTGQELCRATGHTHAIFAVAFLPDGTRFLTGSFDKTLRLWEIPKELTDPQ